ncbi:MAG: Crp/Fnr family transcriptional regulator, partial [Zoogloeaceae bacterium]|nr:Crp/Fnr family transcriptional regulator [Zoogloeaceae bacterium]
LKGAVFAGWHCHDGKDFFHLAPGFGEAINLAPALANIPLMCDFYAHQQSSILLIPHEFIQDIAAKDPSVMASLLGFICKRFTWHVERSIKCRLIDNPRGRLVDMLLYLAARYGRAGEGGVRIDIRLSQNDLAAMLALSRQSINKELNRLAEEGLIAKSYGATTITDIAGLRALDQQQALCPPLHATPTLSAGRHEGAGIGVV